MPQERRRPDRVAEAIREEIATFLNEQAKDPRITGLVTVTSVEVTRDLRHAKVLVSIYGEPAARAATLEGLESLANHLRPLIGRRLRLRLAPEIHFKLDESIAHAARIGVLLSQVQNGRPPADDDLDD
jgi:ribosome-binding factor A